MSMTQDKNAGFVCQPVSGTQSVTADAIMGSGVADNYIIRFIDTLLPSKIAAPDLE